jgi:hypothetical protein
MRKNGHAVLCQTRMYLTKGIIVGAFNGLQLNKRGADACLERGVWQLIAIFEQSKYVSGNAKKKPGCRNSYLYHLKQFHYWNNLQCCQTVKEKVWCG